MLNKDFFRDEACYFLLQLAGAMFAWSALIISNGRSALGAGFFIGGIILGVAAKCGLSR